MLGKRFQLAWWGPIFAREDDEVILRLGYWRFGKSEWHGTMKAIYRWSFYIGPLEIRRSADAN